MVYLNFAVKQGIQCFPITLAKSTSSRATYTSKTIQNDIIEVCNQYIRSKLIEEVTIIADEARDHANKEQLSIVIRFVDKDLAERSFLVSKNVLKQQGKQLLK